MKLEVVKRDITDITVTDCEVVVCLELGISHGAVKKQITPINIEHTVPLFDELFAGSDTSLDLIGDSETGIADAVILAMAGVNKRADETIIALRGLTTL